MAPSRFVRERQMTGRRLTALPSRGAQKFSAARRGMKHLRPVTIRRIPERTYSSSAGNLSGSGDRAVARLPCR